LIGKRRLVFDLQREMMGKAGSEPSRSIVGQAEECDYRTGRDVFIAGVVVMRSTLLIEVVGLLDQMQSNCFDEKLLRTLCVAGY
jgi:hypothetical protein